MSTGISYAPLLSFKGFWSFFRKKEENYFHDGQQFSAVFARGTIALGAFYKAHCDQIGRKVKVFLPEYFCFESTASLQKEGAEIHFYNISDNLEPDFNTLDIPSEEGDIFVLVHFFGNWIDPKNTQIFCREKKLTLLHDAAHCAEKAPFPTDHIFYSPRKQFPLPNGALLFSNEVEIESNYSAWVSVSNLKWFSKKIIQSLLSIVGKTGGNLPNLTLEFFDDRENIDLNEKPFIGIHSFLFKNNIEPLIEKRKLNYLHLQEALKDCEGVRFFIPNFSGTPFFAPLLLSPTFNEINLLEIQKEGVPISRWPNLADTVVNNNKFYLSNYLKKHVILVPIHSSLSPRQIKKIAAVIKKNLSK